MGVPQRNNVIHSGKSDDSQSPTVSSKFGQPLFTSRTTKEGKLVVGVEASLNVDSASDKENNNSNSSSGSGNNELFVSDTSKKLESSKLGLPKGNSHKSRERTRKSAVLKLLERKEKQKEKEKERDRSQRARSDSSSRFYLNEKTRLSRRGSSSLNSTNRNSWVESNITLDNISVTIGNSRKNNKIQESGAKTYITIGPGKPTRIREHSPSKSPNPRERKFSFQPKSENQRPKFDITSKSRDASPTKLNNQDEMTPLKSAQLLKDIPSKTNSTFTAKNRKRSFTTEATIIIGDPNPRTRRMSADVGSKIHVSSSTPRFSISSERESKIHVSNSTPGFNTSSSSNRSSTEREVKISLSSSTSSLSSLGSNDSESHLSKRRISLEERFKARKNKKDINEQEDSDISEENVKSGLHSSASSRLLYNLSFGYRQHRAAASANSSFQERNRRYSQDHSNKNKTNLNVQQQKAEKVRKISLPPTCFEEPQRTSLADVKKDEGNELYKTKSYREALQKYTEAINLAPECPSFYGNRSACYMMLGQYNKALDDSKLSVQLDPAFVKGYIRVAKCCVALGDHITAKQAIDKVAELEPSNSALENEKRNIQTLTKFREDAQKAYELKDFRKALYCLDQALIIATASRQLKISRAECLAFLGRYPESQSLANDLLRADSLCADAIYVRGLCLYYEDHVDKAISHFQQVLRFAPDHAKAKAIYKRAKLLKQKKEEGNVLFKASNWDGALKVYTAALEIDPLNKFTNAKLYFNRAIVAAKLGKYKESVSDCTKALELDEKYTKAILRRAKSYMEMEDFEEAVRDYEKVHRMDQRNPEYRKLLQHAKLELKKSKRKDYYKILGVHKNANDDEIKKGYKKRALVHHPDRHSSATEEEKKEHERKFKEVGEAYGVLTDPKKRSRYDNGHDLEDLDGGHSGFSQDIDPNQIFQAFFGGGMGGAGMGGAGMGGGMGGAGQHHFSFGGGQGGPGHNFTFQF